MITIYKIGIGIILGLWMGMWLTWLTHPYERCSKQYVGDENILECVWLLKNQEALR